MFVENLEMTIISSKSVVYFILIFLYLSTTIHCQCHCSTGSHGSAVGFETYSPDTGTTCSTCYEEFITIDFEVDIDDFDDSEFELTIEVNFFLSNEDTNEGINKRQLTTGDNTSISLYYENSYVGTCKYCTLYKNSYATQERVVIYTNGSFMNFCEPNSEGFFCSKCKEGFYHNLGTSCVECDNLGGQWILYLLSQFIPITIWFAILLYFDFSVICGPLHAALFTAQMLATTMDIDQKEIPVVNITGSSNGAHALTAVYKLIYGPTNLEFFSPFVNNLCLFRTDSYLYNFIPQYLVALYALALVFIGGLVFRFLKWYYKPSTDRKFATLNKYICNLIPSNRLNRPPSKVLASIVVLVYIKFSWLCTLILTPSFLYDYKGQRAKTVSTFDPTINFLEGDNIAIVIMGIICFLFILILPGLLIFLRYNKLPKYLKVFKVFLEPFQSHFKCELDDELEEKKLTKWKKWLEKVHLYSNKQCISGLYFVMRICLLMIYLLSKDIMFRLVLYQFILVIGALLFLIIQPYSNKSTSKRPSFDNNKLDTCILLILAFINTISMLQYYRASKGQHLSVLAFVVQYILIFVPFIWFIYYTVHHVYINFKHSNGRLYFRSKSSDATKSMKNTTAPEITLCFLC